MDKEIATPAATGISRREMLFGAGILAAGYGVGQLTVATNVVKGNPVDLAPMACNPGATGLPWPAAWNLTGEGTAFENAARLASVRAYNRFRYGAG